MDPVAQSVYGPTDGYSARAHPPPLTHRATLRETNVCARARSSANLYVPTRTGTYSVHDAMHGESVRVSFNVYVYTCVCMRVYIKRIRARSYQYRRTRPPVHQGTKPKAINLFARQPATRHCVYPHVNHYVRLRDIEPDTRPVSQRISNSPFPAVGQNAWISSLSSRATAERRQGANRNDWISLARPTISATLRNSSLVIEFTGCPGQTTRATRLWNSTDSKRPASCIDVTWLESVVLGFARSDREMV